MKLPKTTQTKIILKTIGIALLLSLVAVLPFLHNIIIEKGVGTKPWVPNLGLEELLTNKEGKVHGYSSYRTFMYFTLLHIFAAIGWLGWAKDAKPGKPYKFFLLIPAGLALYTCLASLFDFRTTRFNNADFKIGIILFLNFIISVFFLYRYFKKHTDNE